MSTRAHINSPGSYEKLTGELKLSARFVKNVIDAHTQKGR